MQPRRRRPVRDAEGVPVAALTFVVTSACAGCGACLLTCPQRAIRPRPGGRLDVLDDRCSRCGECVEICPVDAIREVPW